MSGTPHEQNGARLGTGIYLSDDPCQSWRYSGSDNGTFVLAICQVGARTWTELDPLRLGHPGFLLTGWSPSGVGQACRGAGSLLWHLCGQGACLRKPGPFLPRRRVP
eukprot:2254484-Rhodomonas_salina.2